MLCIYWDPSGFTPVKYLSCCADVQISITIRIQALRDVFIKKKIQYRITTSDMTCLIKTLRYMLCLRFLSLFCHKGRILN